MPTLSINFNIRPPEIRLRGLGIRNCPRNVVKSDAPGWLSIETDFGASVVVNGKLLSAEDHSTARIREEYLIEILTEIYHDVEFDKVITRGYYHLTGDQIMKKVLDKIKATS